MPSGAVRPYSVDAYRTLISSLLTGGCTFSSFTDAPAADGRTIYLRHDVDYSLQLAETLAEVNNELGIGGTFFVQVRAELYNVFAPSETARLRRIRSLGQGIALHHLDQAVAPGADEVIEIQRNFELLARVEPELDHAFSWHRPTADLLDRPDVDVPGLVNVYGRRFFREMPYLSDSTHTVEESPSLEAARAAINEPELQLLFHPGQLDRRRHERR